MERKTSAELGQSAVAVCVTAILLFLCTWGEIGIQHVAGVNRPYTIFYLIPVAVAAALLGIRGGVLTALAAVALARVYLFTDDKHGLALISFPSTAEAVEFFALLLGTLTIALVTGRLRATLGHLKETYTNLKEANQKLTESEQQRRVFNRDVLLAVTGGKLRLVEPDEIPLPGVTTGPSLFSLPLSEPKDATDLRHRLTVIGQLAGMDMERLGDLATAATEAATNAIKHGNGGQATVWATKSSVTIQIEDRGTGITPDHLARATMEQGFSTRISLGMGFHLMLQAADTLALCTGATGTTILLQISTKPRQTLQDSVLARYTNVSELRPTTTPSRLSR
jgi:anti-sigma regulatory factor (Ser/Thr protein kinase)